MAASRGPRATLRPCIPTRPSPRPCRACTAASSIRVETLERRGGRDEASRLRRQAITVYSGAWDAKSHRRLEEIATRAELAARDQERRGGPRAA